MGYVFIAASIALGFFLGIWAGEGAKADVRKRPEVRLMHGPDEHGVVCYVHINYLSCVKVR